MLVLGKMSTTGVLQARILELLGESHGQRAWCAMVHGVTDSWM